MSVLLIYKFVVFEYADLQGQNAKVDKSSEKSNTLGLLKLKLKVQNIIIL